MDTLNRRETDHFYTVIGALVIDRWAVTFGTARKGLGGLRPRLVPVTYNGGLDPLVANDFNFI